MHTMAPPLRAVLGFIAAALAFFNDARTNPPDQWMKPENGFDQHVQYGNEIVAAAHMTKLVGDDGFEMSIIEVARDRVRPHQNWAKHAEESGLERCPRQHNVYWRAGESLKAL